jgi:hypothetical protein
MIYCLPEPFVGKMKEAMKSGKIDPMKLNEMDSASRRKFLSEIIGEDHSQQVNLLFEKKLLLKNQEKAIYDWAKQITGLSKKDKEETALKIKKAFEEKQRRIYDPKEHEQFLNEITSDVYSKKYKTGVSLEEAQRITELTQDAKVTREKLDELAKTNPDKNNLGINADKVALDNYIGDLKIQANKRSMVNPLKQPTLGGKANAMLSNAKISANFIAENSRAIVASIDNSLWGRQGARALADPRFTKIWAKDFAKSWTDIGKTLRGGIGKGQTGKDIVLGRDAVKAGEDLINGLKAEIYGRKNYLNNRYDANIPGGGAKGTKLDIGTGEEQYPTSFPEKIPVLGRLFKGSNIAYEAGAMRLRTDIADKVYAMAEKSGANLADNKIVGDLNEIVNGITGRGTFGGKSGKAEKAINNAFFSVKFFKSNLDYLTMPFRGSERISAPARKLAATNLLYTIATTATVLKIAQSLNPEDNKNIFNPTSSNFGKIKAGKMTVDTTHGAGGIVVAAARVLAQQSTNNKGISTPLGGYGKSDGMDILYDFTENKLSPVASVIKDMVKQKTFTGEKPTILGEAKNLTMPITLGNIGQFSKEPAPIALIGLIADGLGFNTNVIPTKNEFKINGIKGDFKIK